MKFVRFGPQGNEKPGLIDGNGDIRDLSAIIDDIDGGMLADDRLADLRKTEIEALPLVSDTVRLGPCIGNPGKFVCVGLNYSDHAAEAGLDVPDEPVLFMKATSSISGPNDTIVIPRGSTKTDWEVELGLIIGRETKYVEEAQALDHVAGYCAVNDVSERHFQIERSGQWVKGKSADTFGPVGPWLVTRDEIPDPLGLGLWLTVNGERRQDGRTATMIFSPAFIVSYISRFMSLQPGDIVSTGTPPGVGLGMTPPTFLKPGDIVELGVEGLGQQRQEVVAAS